MNKKNKVEETVIEGVSPAKAILVAPLDIDFGRGDLNDLRDKLNEVISILNER